jgi:hypothetical protein
MRFHSRIQGKLRQSVWNSGCQSWYLKDGRNASLWPSFTFAYWWQTRRIALADYELVAEPAVEEYPEALPAPTL